MERWARGVVASGYDAIGARCRDWSSASPGPPRLVELLLRRLPADSTVIDLGCGPAEPATRLLSTRHRVLGVDLSLVQLRLARQAAPSAAFVRADMTEVELRAGSVDAVASFYALGHLPPGTHAPLLRSVTCWLRPGGLLLTSAPLTADDAVDPDRLGVPMYFGGIDEQATLRGSARGGRRLRPRSLRVSSRTRSPALTAARLTAHHPGPG